MADLGIQNLQAGAEAVSAAAIPFRFEVSWRSLTLSPEPSRAAAPTGACSIAIGLQPSEVSKEWESVLPFVMRGRTLEPSPMELAPESLEAPGFRMAANGASRKWGMLVVVGLLATFALAAAGLIGRGSSSPDVSPTVTMEMGEVGWVAEWVSDAMGSALGRQLSLYRPSIGMSDYRLEFTGRIDRKSLGWVFRAADTRNYYVGKVHVSKPSGRLAVTRFAVVRGVEGPPTRITLPLLPGTGALKVRLDAKRSRFTIYVQNEVVDDWQDDRLTTGGVGFLNERAERGQVESVQISFPKNGVSQ